ncbi:ferredoxin [Yoonia sp. R2331]|uniref:ferredoxin n=1 Tax=Yoonia sp. R2331 TaxID=3237238 RepID=UPI0034E5750B
MTDLATLLAPYALTALGRCPLGPDDGVSGRSLVLIGPDEPRFWQTFAGSAECRDGAPDPLDRWSKRVLDAVATQLGTTAVYPFGGPPFHPFIGWALRCGVVWSSPISLLVHNDAGLFVSFRGALVLDAPAPATKAARPCDACHQPCKTACPVDAFADGYDVAACKAHVRAAAGHDCRSGGCLARRACPVGQHRRLPAQSAFHMEAFL